MYVQSMVMEMHYGVERHVTRQGVAFGEFGASLCCTERAVRLSEPAGDRAMVGIRAGPRRRETIGSHRIPTQPGL